jgi:hypothetical protein
LPGEEARAPKARDVLRLLEQVKPPFVRLIGCRRVADPLPADAVVFDVEVELPQHKIHDVRRWERIAALFWDGDVATPEVLALRADFPPVPHLNLRTQELPRSLCLYDEPYSEVKLRWTAAGFVERIREWLALTARGELHAEDQELEPLLMGSPWWLVVPTDLVESARAAAPELLEIEAVQSDRGKYTLVARRVEGGVPRQQAPRFVATAFLGEPQPHGLIREQPATLRRLHEFLLPAGIDLLRELRLRLPSWRVRSDFAQLTGAQPIIVAALPKTRTASGAVESQEVWAFLCSGNLGQLGDEIDAWGMVGGYAGALLAPDADRRGDEVRLDVLNTTYAFSPERAAELAGLALRDTRRIVAVGAGAMGSQVFMNLMRMGYGQWVLIDYDELLPHNLARHALFGYSVGQSKAAHMSALTNHTLAGAPFVESIVADVLQPGESEASLNQALARADIILDASASVPVARYLARDIESSARRISVFFNPAGTDGVLLAEDLERRSPLDWLEMLYYRRLIGEPQIQGHLGSRSGRIRYARSCRDLSNEIPQDLVALHTASATRALRAAAERDVAAISLWRSNADDVGIEHIPVDVTEAIEVRAGDWTVCVDSWLLDKVMRSRAGKLPNETGGVLVGMHDMQRKILYVLDTLPSPPDSTEWPTVYIRGSRGLTTRLDEIGRLTARSLGYVGEWHSHPDGFGTTPSSDDGKALAWLADIMTAAGLPALMLIAGDCGQHSWYVEAMP